MSKKPTRAAPNAPAPAGTRIPWPAEAVAMRTIDDLVPYAKNARVHSEDQIEQVAKSIKEFGWTIPVLIAEDGTIIAGHCRILAAAKLGIVDVPVMIARGWSDAKRRAYTLADNKLALNATWDDELLRIELTELSFDETIDFDAFGFSQSELDKILSAAPPTTDEEIDDVNPQVPRQPVSQPGDIWDMGEHKLICGDSTDPTVVARVLNGSRPTLLFTSPPYGQQRDYTVGIDDWTSLMEGVFGASLPVMADAGQVLVNLGLIHRDGEWLQYWTGWIEWMRSAGWKKFGLYVWDQGPGLPGDWGGRLAPAFEFVFHFNRSSRKPNKIVEAKNAGQLLAGTGLRGADGKLHKKTGHGKPIQDMKIPDSVIRIMRHHGKIEAGAHPAVMAVKLPRFVIETFTDLGETILEPFCGSGSTILAGEQTGRVVRAVELAPEYVDVAVMRWNTVFPDMPATMRGKTLGALARERGCADDVGGRGK